MTGMKERASSRRLVPFLLWISAIQNIKEEYADRGVGQQSEDIRANKCIRLEACQRHHRPSEGRFLNQNSLRARKTLGTTRQHERMAHYPQQQSQLPLS